MGITVGGMRNFVQGLGPLKHALAQCNAAIARREDGSLKFPKNEEFNGYGG